MPKAVSKRQQAFFWAQVRRGQMSATEARRRSVKGKAFKKLPAKKRRPKGRRR
jgi:hypothetical protein